MSSSSQAESCSNGGLSPYVQMLVSFGNVPEWHNLLSALFIWMITTGFITIPPALITVVENNNQSTQTGNGQTSADNNNQPSQTGDGNHGLLLQFALSEPLYVQFHFPTFSLLDFIKSGSLKIPLKLRFYLFLNLIRFDVDPSPDSRSASRYSSSA
jgi:hypothetical protein